MRIMLREKKMVNEIKLDKSGVNLTPASSIQQPVKQQTAAVTRDEDVTVTNHLSKLINLLGKDEATPEDSARVTATKRLIESGQYVVDVNTLSEKLLSSGLFGSGE